MERSIRADVESAFSAGRAERKALATAKAAVAMAHSAGTGDVAKAASIVAEQEHFKKSLAVIANMRCSISKPEQRVPTYAGGRSVPDRMDDARSRMLAARLSAAEQRLADFEHFAPYRVAALSAEVDPPPQQRAARPAPSSPHPLGKQLKHAEARVAMYEARLRRLAQAQAQAPKPMREAPPPPSPVPKHTREAPALPASARRPETSIHYARHRVGTFGTSPRFPDQPETYSMTPLHSSYQPSFQNVPAPRHRAPPTLPKRPPPPLPA